MVLKKRPCFPYRRSAKSAGKLRPFSDILTYSSFNRTGGYVFEVYGLTNGMDGGLQDMREGFSAPVITEMAFSILMISACRKSDVISVSGACNEAWLKTGCQDTFMISVLITKEYKRIFSGVHFLLNELCNVGIPFSTGLTFFSKSGTPVSKRQIVYNFPI